MNSLEKSSPLGTGPVDSLSSCDLGHVADPDAGLSEAQKKELVSFSSCPSK